MVLIGCGFWAIPALALRPTPPAAAIATAHPLATQAGEEILAAGGNAFDAAVAVSAALGVVEPGGSGLGGGGFFLLHEGETGRKRFIDAREVAPLAIRGAMYHDEEGQPDRDKLTVGPLASGIPGLPAALVHLADNYGRLPLSRSLAPAIRYAREGMAVRPRLARIIERRAAHLQRFASTRAIWFADDQPLQEGAILRQRDLSRTLEKLAAFGRDGFYAGPVADTLVASVQAAGGVWTAQDLEQYRIIERAPLVLSFGDWQIVSAPPPSSGGLVIGIALNLLERMGYAKASAVDRKHMLIEAMRRAYFDRTRYMGDPDFVDVPSRTLLSAAHAEQWLKSFDPRQATPSADLAPEPIASVGMGVNTTHFSLMDSDGNRVAATLSLNYLLGSGFVAGDTGVLLNNEMDDFVIAPGVANAYDLTGGEANLIAPGKRMLSSMSPAFLEGADRVAALGTPGGSRIISMVLLALLQLMDDPDAQAAVALPRFHHQYLPDLVQLGPGALTAAERKTLRARGHTLEDMGWDYGNMQLIQWHLRSGQVDAAADPRGGGLAVVLPSSRAPTRSANDSPTLDLETRP